MNSIIAPIRRNVRAAMESIAKWLDHVSGGHISPNQITALGLLAHLPIAWLIADGQLVLAGVLLIIFGLFDSLDGALARIQKSTSSAGMFLDSVTDRVKEALLYIGIFALLYSLSADRTILLVTAVALSVSLITSYVNAWGEVAFAQHRAATNPKTRHHVNQMLRMGVLSFELRISLIIIGLLLNQLEIVLWAIAVLGGLTVWQRVRLTLGKLA
jgi:CDP-diacylglycerol---glycerol-3-phosphate 3-phosphatidyltransferase